MKLFARSKPAIADERRIAGPRVRVDCMATMLMPSGDRPARLFDISIGGARITLQEPPAKGVSAILDWGSHEAYCKVIWSKPGMCGVQFDKPIASKLIDELAKDAPSGPRLVHDREDEPDPNRGTVSATRPQFGC